MIDPNIEWPLHVSDRLDPDHHHIAPDVKELGYYVEFWNSLLEVDSNSWEIVDAKGRRVVGFIECLEVRSLYLDE